MCFACCCRERQLIRASLLRPSRQRYSTCPKKTSKTVCLKQLAAPRSPLGGPAREAAAADVEGALASLLPLRYGSIGGEGREIAWSRISSLIDAGLPGGAPNKKQSSLFLFEERVYSGAVHGDSSRGEAA